ncbi:hypothetical protein DFP73DRAFT_593124 [Morchella snyderi]|nr:hypothetical protein DFP73DRAFT_593124 [Morchella snyderi]
MPHTKRSRRQPPSTKDIARCTEEWKTHKEKHKESHNESHRFHVCHYQSRREGVGHDTGSVWVVPVGTISTLGAVSKPHRPSKINVSSSLSWESAGPISPLFGVPTEILLLIAGYLTHEESIILSLTCKHLKTGLGLCDAFSSIMFSLACTDDALIRVMRDMDGPYKIPALNFLLGRLKTDPNDSRQRDAFLGWHALHFGCYYNDETAIAALLRYGANPNIPDVTGATSLHICYLFRPTTPGARYLLLDPPLAPLAAAKANKRLVDKLGVLPGMYYLKMFREAHRTIYRRDIEDYLGFEITELLSGHTKMDTPKRKRETEDGVTHVEVKKRKRCREKHELLSGHTKMDKPKRKRETDNDFTYVEAKKRKRCHEQDEERLTQASEDWRKHLEQSV